MTSNAKTVEEYLDELPADRRAAIAAVRETVKANLQPGFEEGMQYGMIGYFVPHSIYPPGYHCDPKQPLNFAGIASQKNHMAVYLFCIYVTDARRDQFIEAYKATGKKLDMGASCVRFKKLEDLPLELIGETIKSVTLDDFLTRYQSIIPEKKKKK